MSRSAGWRQVDRVLMSGLRAGAAPGAALVVGTAEEVLYERGYGVLGGKGPAMAATVDSVYDLSSLTKPLATLSALLILIAEGKLDFSTPVAQLLPAMQGEGRDEITVAQLLCHASGLPAWKPYFRSLENEQAAKGRPLLASRNGRERVYELIATEPLAHPPGRVCLYSDLGFMLLGEIIERLAGSTLDVFVRDRVFAPLGLEQTGFVDLERSAEAGVKLDHVAPCGPCPWRQRLICGIVQDENAYAMGGVAGHAGLFSTAREVHALVAEYVRSFAGSGRLLSSSLVEQCWSEPSGPTGSTWRLGWDSPCTHGSSAGQRISRRAVGHLGFTGTSVWVDLLRGVHVILLTNRLAGGRDNLGIRQLRPQLYDAVFAAVD